MCIRDRWNSRVNASFSYYNNYTDELLLDYNMAPSTGFASKTMNVGAVENEGYDISLSVMPVSYTHLVCIFPWIP